MNGNGRHLNRVKSKDEDIVQSFMKIKAELKARFKNNELK